MYLHFSLHTRCLKKICENIWLFFSMTKASDVSPSLFASESPLKFENQLE